jgi:DNA polymerase III subunit delta'
VSDDEIEQDQGSEAAPPEVKAPRENPFLFGHAVAEQALLQAHQSGRLPHAWLIAGPRGIGKATLAFRFARFLLAERDGGSLAEAPSSLAIEPSHPVFRRVASGGHADLLTVERGLDSRRKRLRSEIVIEDTRAISSFLRLTPAEGRWRVVILDGADVMNRNAANALLKILEEPPRRAVLLLASDNPGRLLPTIRSRCRILTLKPLAPAIVEEALRRYRPDLAAGDLAMLAELAEGSIGRALELAAANGLALYRSLVRLLDRLPALDGASLHAFADSFGGANEESFRLLAELLPGWLARMVVSAAAQDGRRLTALKEAETMQRLAGRRGLDQWIEVWENLTQLFALADSVNLDRKQVVLNAFFTLEDAARAAPRS